MGEHHAMAVLDSEANIFRVAQELVPKLEDIYGEIDEMPYIHQ